MSGRVPHAAFCEEYDEDANVILPETRQVANISSRQSKPDLKPAEANVDGASDSGYSSRTAATVNSSQSVPSEQRSPPALKPDAPLKRPDKGKLRESRKEKGRDRERKPAVLANKMPLATRRSSSRPPPHQPSKPKRHESASVQHNPDTCWECEQGLHHTSAPVEPRTMDYPPYYYPQPPPAVDDYPPSPKSAARYSPYVEDVHVSQSSRRRNRSNSYHSNGRPLSFHGMTPEMGMYSMVPVGQYDHGPPLSASAYANAPTYPPPQHQYYGRQESVPQSPYERPRERSHSRTREPQPRRRSPGRRRSSVYVPPAIDYSPPAATYEDGGVPLERGPSREHRLRVASPSYEPDEDYYRMPPPPPKSKPQVIQRRPNPPRKSAATRERRLSDSFDMSELEDALPDRPVRTVSRDTIVPGRSRSVKSVRRASTYRESSPSPARTLIEDSRRRRLSVYDYEPRDVEQKQRDAEEYQASKTGKTVPLTADALFKAKSFQRPDSDSGSQKSRSTSSRGSDTRTRDGSNSKHEDEENNKNNLVMTMNGVTMSIPQDSVGGKRISLRTGDQGDVTMSIEGRRPRKYLTSRSEYASTSGRTDAEDYRRPRDDRRSDLASRRSSRSTYSSRRLLE